MDNELFELCKEVYERTDWDSNDLCHKLGDEVFYRELFDSDIDEKHPRKSYCPLYTSDYLLEKLGGLDQELSLHRCHHMDGTRNWCAERDDPESDHVSKFAYAGTPLKALLKLITALHEAGQLK